VTRLKIPHGNIWLVVEPYPSEKYEFVSWDDEIPSIWENKNVPNHTNQIYLYPSVDDFPTYSFVYRGFSILWMDKPAAPVGKYW